MKNTGLAFRLFVVGYLIATIVGFSTFYIDLTVMWVTIFTLMPLVFGYFFYTYLRRTDCERSRSFRETNALVLFWMILSFLVDALVYIVVVPLYLRQPAKLDLLHRPVAVDLAELPDHSRQILAEGVGRRPMLRLE